MRETAALNQAVEGVVIGGTDGVELVIVAPRAGDGHALKGFANDIDLVVDHLGLISAHVHRRVAMLAEPPPCGGQPAFVPAAVLGKARLEQIAGDVFLHETIVGHIVIEGADHIVTIAPHFLIHEIELVPERLRVTHQI